MTMRKKDYQAISRAIYVSHFYYSRAATVDQKLRLESRLAAERISQQIADYCATQDPTFKRDRFLADCGVNQS